MLPIVLSMVEGCAQSPHSNVLSRKGLSAKRKGFLLLALSSLHLLPRLASEIFLSSLRSGFYSYLLRNEERKSR